MNRSLLAMLLVGGAAFAQRVPWTYETPPVLSSQPGDPAFLLSPGPTVVGTDTTNPNLYFWQLGQPDLSYAVGPVNSADARGTLVAVASFNTNTVLLFQAEADGGYSQLNTGGFTVPSPRHVALRQTVAGDFEIYVDTSSQTIEHHALAIAGGVATFTPLTPMRVAEPPSGIAVDDRTGQLYVSQPSLGMMRVEFDTNRSFLLSIDAGHLGTLVGGVDLYPVADGGVLIFTASPNQSQVDVHSGGGAYLGTLTVGDVDGGAGVLGTPNSLDVFAQPAPGFPRGVLVVEDSATSNYKVISLADVDAVFPLPQPWIPPVIVDGGTPDAGAADGGTTDAGSADAGSRPDAGPTDGGATGAGGGSGGNSGRPPPSADPMTPSCGCTGGPFALLPGVLLLWWIRRLRSTRS